MNSFDFKGRTAIVTGGAQGIGKAVSAVLAKGGGRIAVWDTDNIMARETAKQLGQGCLAVDVDIASWDSVQAAYAATIDQFEKVDILVNSAGIAGSNGPVEAYAVEEFHQIVAVNLLGTFHVNKAVIAGMRAQNYGRIVNIASIAGKEGNPNAPAYSAAKAGVIGLTKSLGKELADTGVRVNCVTPAAARTRIFDQMTQKQIDYMLSKIPMERFVAVEEIAALVAWLASEDCAFSTGAVFDISGGRATY